MFFAQQVLSVLCGEEGRSSLHVLSLSVKSEFVLVIHLHFSMHICSSMMRNRD